MVKPFNLNNNYYANYKKINNTIETFVPNLGMPPAQQLKKYISLYENIEGKIGRDELEKFIWSFREEIQQALKIFNEIDNVIPGFGKDDYWQRMINLCLKNAEGVAKDLGQDGEYYVNDDDSIEIDWLDFLESPERTEGFFSDGIINDTFLWNIKKIQRATRIMSRNARYISKFEMSDPNDVTNNLLQRADSLAKKLDVRGKRINKKILNSLDDENAGVLEILDLEGSRIEAGELFNSRYVSFLCKDLGDKSVAQALEDGTYDRRIIDVF